MYESDVEREVVSLVVCSTEYERLYRCLAS